MSLYPWQTPIWQQLWQSGIERMPQGLLLHGGAGIGKHAFAKTLAQSLLCTRHLASDQACGECDACRYFGQNAHPDFRLVTPEAEEESSEGAVAEPVGAKEKKASEFITIHQIRGLGDFIALTSHQNSGRVILISPAEQLNLNAANALLKMLEEPPPQTRFLLVTNHLGRILPTVRSRCRLLKMPMPNPAQASAWLAEQRCPDPALNLALAGRAPLDALENGENVEWQTQRKRFCDALSQPDAGDAIAMAESVLKLAPASVMRWLQTWIYDLVSLQTTQESRYHLDRTKTQISLNKTVQLIDLLNFNLEVSSAKRLILHPLNPKLFWESLFIQYFKLFK